MALTTQELISAISQGFASAPAAIPTALAVVMAESGGDPNAVGDNGTSFGLFQIHLPAHPDISKECALDPVCASHAAFRISNAGTNWTAWSTWNNGAASKYLSSATSAVGQTNTQDVMTYASTSAAPANVTESNISLGSGMAKVGAFALMTVVVVVLAEPLPTIMVWVAALIFSYSLLQHVTGLASVSTWVTTALGAPAPAGGAVTPQQVSSSGILRPGF